jgi:ribose transport system permease protein
MSDSKTSARGNPEPAKSSADRAPGAGGKRRSAGAIFRFKELREGNLLLIILAISVAMSFLSPVFLTTGNMKAFLLSFATDGIVVVGMTLILIVGGIDLSVGSVLCFSGILLGTLFNLGVNPWIAAAITLVVMTLQGAFVGFMVTRVGLSFFITTLATMVIFRGASYTMTNGAAISLYTLPAEFKFIGQGTVYGIPLTIIIFFIIIIVADFLMRRATIFRKAYYVGSSEKAAKFSGINVDKVKIGASVFCSFLAALAGIIYTSRYGAATVTMGNGLELIAISAAVIGGASLNGGEGSILGAILGIALLSLVTTSMILLDVSAYWIDFVRGLILLAAVTIDQLAHRRAGTRIA